MYIRDLTNEEVFSLSKELKTISDADKPKDIKRSKLLITIWDSFTSDYLGYMSDFSNVKNYINSEIIHRINTDKMKLI